MSPDLRHATVFVKSLLGRDEEAVLKALRTNTAYLQREVARRIRMKYAAKLKFLSDESFDEASHIDKLLRDRSEEHTSELQSLMRISYAVFCLKKKKNKKTKENAQTKVTKQHTDNKDHNRHTQNTQKNIEHKDITKV